MQGSDLVQRMATYVGCKEKGQELKKGREAAAILRLWLASPRAWVRKSQSWSALTLAPHQLVIMSAADSSSSSSSVSDGQPETWDDWTEEPVAAKSLFDDSTHPSPQAALQHDKETHGVDLLLLASTLGELINFQLCCTTSRSSPRLGWPPSKFTDFFERIRLINWIRSTVSSRRPSLLVYSKLISSCFAASETRPQDLDSPRPKLRLPRGRRFPQARR